MMPTRCRSSTSTRTSRPNRRCPITGRRWACRRKGVLAANPPGVAGASALEAAGLQPCLFCRGGFPPQQTVAMREAAESFDDAQVVICPSARLGFRNLAKQRDAAPLVLDGFRMHEGQVEERA